MSWYARTIGTLFRYRSFLLLPLFVAIGSLWYWNSVRLVSVHIPSSSGPGYVLTLSNKEKSDLHFFFRYFMLVDGAIYSLLGNKPMSLCGYVKPSGSFRLQDIFISYFPSELKIYRGWQTFLKYQHLVDHSRFLIWAEKSPWFKGGEIILFMNKKETEGIIKRYSGDFCAALNKEQVDMEALILESCSKPFFLEVLQKHEGLIGTLLGYGRENAWLFLRRDLGETISLQSPWDLKKERAILNERYGWLSFFKRGEKEIADEVFTPGFVADLHSEETRELKENYLATQEYIIKTLRGKDFLEIVLGLIFGQISPSNF